MPSICLQISVIKEKQAPDRQDVDCCGGNSCHPHSSLHQSLHPTIKLSPRASVPCLCRVTALPGGIGRAQLRQLDQESDIYISSGEEPHQLLQEAFPEIR